MSSRLPDSRTTPPGGIASVPKQQSSPRLAEARKAQLQDQWSRIWFSALRTPWESLALVPAQGGPLARQAATALLEIGQMHGQRPITLLDTEGFRLPDVTRFVDSFASARVRDEIPLILVDCPTQSAAAIPIARHAEAALLVVGLGEARIAAARDIIETVGRERFIGTVVLRRR